MDTSMFYNQTFKLHRLNRSVGPLEPAQKAYVVTNLAQYWYDETRRHDDAETHYESPREVEQTLTVEWGPLAAPGGHHVEYMVISSRDGAFPRQTILAVTNSRASPTSYSTVLLCKNVAPLTLQLLETMDSDVPLVVRDYRWKAHELGGVATTMFGAVNAVEAGNRNGVAVNMLHQTIGDLELTYSRDTGAINANLKHIVVSVPHRDVVRFDGGDLLAEVERFLKQTTQMDVGNLDLVRVSSMLLSVGVEGRLKVSDERMGGRGPELVGVLLGVVARE